MTAEEFLKDNCYIDQLLGGENSELYKEVKVLMNLYAKHHVKEALNVAANISDAPPHQPSISSKREIILSCYPDENIV